MKGRFLILIFLLGLVEITALAQVKTSNFLLLQQADNLRTSDFERFSDLMSTLDKKNKELTVEEKFYFQYLSGYKNALDGNQLNAERQYLIVFKNSQTLTLRYRAAFSLVNLYVFMQNWTQGIHYVQFIENNSEYILNAEIRHIGLIAAGLFYNKVEYYEAVEKLMSTVLIEDASGRNMCMAKGILLKAQLSLKKRFDLNNVLADAISVCKQQQENTIVSMIRTYIGNYYLEMGKLTDALNAVNPYLKDIESSQYSLIIVDAYALLARIYWSLNHHVMAKRFAEKTLSFKEKKSDVRSSMHAYDILSKVYMVNNISSETNTPSNLIKVIEYLKKYNYFKHQLFIEINAKQLAMELAHRNVSVRDEKIVLLKQQNSSLRSELTNENRQIKVSQWLTNLLLTVLILLLMLGAYFQYSQRKLKSLLRYDGLTGLFSRYFFDQELELILRQFSKIPSSACLLLVKVNLINSAERTYDLMTKHELLIEIAKLLESEFPENSMIARVSDCKFVVFLPNYNIDMVIPFANNICSKVNLILLQKFKHQTETQVNSNMIHYGVTSTDRSGFNLKCLYKDAGETLNILPVPG
ncbi:GGDEF domain-containing protein [Aliikangiella maris]|uniref:Diguanylate cyclase n=2 Tax=Aliikangiella maris TaxID=3162458 RepID=A0ABV3MI70_9GAMM